MAKMRIQLSVEPELGALIRDLADETNESMSGLIADLLMEVAPVLEKNLEMIRAAKKLKDSGRERVKKHMELTIQKMEEELKRAQEIHEMKMQ